jgi:hypothetical protein
LEGRRGDGQQEFGQMDLNTGANKSKATTFGPMAEVVQNSTSQLSDADLTAMAEYLKSMPPDSGLRTGIKAVDPTRQQGATHYMGQRLDQCPGRLSGDLTSDGWVSPRASIRPLR